MFAALPFPDLSPDVFSIDLFGRSFALRWYALAYIAGVIIGWRIAVAAVRRVMLWPGNQPPTAADDVEDLMTWIILGVIAGGRLGYVLFYKPAEYLSRPLDILKVWEGGMSFHGGFLGVVVAILLWSRLGKRPLGSVADMIAIATPPGLFLGRIANFINAELWGRETTAPWGVYFPGQAAESCSSLVMLCARHPSQLYEAALEGLLLGALLLWLAFHRGLLRRRWLATGTFFAGYALARMFVELFRQPDAQFVTDGNPLGLLVQAGNLGLTAGQVYSLPMLAVGLWLIWRARRA